MAWFQALRIKLNQRRRAPSRGILFSVILIAILLTLSSCLPLKLDSSGAGNGDGYTGVDGNKEVKDSEKIRQARMEDRLGIFVGVPYKVRTEAGLNASGEPITNLLWNYDGPKKDVILVIEGAEFFDEASFGFVGSVHADDASYKFDVTDLMNNKNIKYFRLFAYDAKYYSPYSEITVKINPQTLRFTSGKTYLAPTLVNAPLFSATIEKINSTADSTTIDSIQDTLISHQTQSKLYYLEVLNGSKAGTVIDIIDNADNTLTLAHSLDEGIDEGTRVQISKYHTLNSLFGKKNEAGFCVDAPGETEEIQRLTGGNHHDLIQIAAGDSPDDTQGDYYYYAGYGLSDTTIEPGWIDSQTQKPAGDLPIRTHQGIIIQRAWCWNGAATVTFRGFPNKSVGHINITGGSSKVVAVPILKGLTLANGNFYSGDPMTGLAAGTSETADLLIVAEGDWMKFYPMYYYMTQEVIDANYPGSAAKAGWKKRGADIVEDYSNVVLKAGTSFIIQRRYPTSFVWNIPKL